MTQKEEQAPRIAALDPGREKCGLVIIFYS